MSSHGAFSAFAHLRQGASFVASLGRPDRPRKGPACCAGALPAPRRAGALARRALLAPGCRAGGGEEGNERERFGTGQGKVKICDLYSCYASFSRMRSEGFSFNLGV